MREILFHGKRIDNGEWVEGFLIIGMGRTFIVGDVIDYDTEYIAPEWWYVVDPATVGQYTGLPDKNGVKIFEGNVCKDSLGYLFQVVFDIETSRFIGKHKNPRGDCYICYIGREPVPVEVIGNIHDNPDLLG